MNKILLIIVSFLFFSASMYAQSVSVNADGSKADSSAILDVKSTSKGVLVPRVTITEKNAIASPAVGLLVFQTNVDSGFYYFNGSAWIKIAEKPRHYVGELYQGGVVFYVDGTGDHGLIASLVILSTSSVWSNIANVEIGAAAQSSWNGQGNTNAIIAQAGHTNSAAKLCNDYINLNYGTGIYTDWYLPAIDELHMLFMSRLNVNKAIAASATGNEITQDGYWSSTETIASNIYAEFFWPLTGGFGNWSKDSQIGVRAVRAF